MLGKVLAAVGIALFILALIIGGSILVATLFDVATYNITRLMSEEKASDPGLRWQVIKFWKALWEWPRLIFATMTEKIRDEILGTPTFWGPILYFVIPALVAILLVLWIMRR